METHARYILIGTFTLAGIFGIMATILWFAKVGIDRQFAYYDIDFASVSGLSDASEVRFSGFPVGKVIDLSLAPDNSGRIRVRIEVAADTPVRTDTIATVEAQGITGVGFVGLSAGEPIRPLLRDVSPDAVPIIPSGRSVVQVLSEEAPQILEDAANIVHQLREILGDENKARVAAILENVETASAQLQLGLDDYTGLAATVNDTFTRADETLARLNAAIETGDQAFASADRAFVSANDLIGGDVTAIAADLRTTLTELKGVVDRLSVDLPQITTNLRSTSEHANAAFDELERTVSASSGPVQQFASEGLPQYARLAREARDLVQSLEQMVHDIERDRARYFLGNEKPLYER